MAKIMIGPTVEDHAMEDLRCAHAFYNSARLALLKMQVAVDGVTDVERTSIVAAISILQEVDEQIIMAYGRLVINRDVSEYPVLPNE